MFAWSYFIKLSWIIFNYRLNKHVSLFEIIYFYRHQDIVEKEELKEIANALRKAKLNPDKTDAISKEWLLINLLNSLIYLWLDVTTNVDPSTIWKEIHKWYAQID